MGIGRLDRAWPALLAVVVLAGCEGLFAPPDVAAPITGLDLEQRPGRVEPAMPGMRGPVIELASGEVGGDEFTLTIYRAAEDFCLALLSLQFGGAGCGPAPGEGLPEFGRFGMIGQGGFEDGIAEVHGMVAPEVARVWAVTQDGERANAVLTPVEIDGVEMGVFVVFLPEGLHVASVVAADASGEVITEVPLVSIAPGGPGAPGGHGAPATPGD